MSYDLWESNGVPFCPASHATSYTHVLAVWKIFCFRLTVMTWTPLGRLASTQISRGGLGWFDTVSWEPREVRQRVGFTGGLFWTAFGFRLFFVSDLFFGSKPVPIGSWGRKRPQEPI
jgi:hypothetical protein